MDYSSCKSGRIPSAFQWRLRCVPARHIENSPQPLIIGSGPGINGLIENCGPSKVATPMTKRKTISSCIRCFTCSSPFRSGSARRFKSCDKSIRIGRLYSFQRMYHIESEHKSLANAGNDHTMYSQQHMIRYSIK